MEGKIIPIALFQTKGIAPPRSPNINVVRPPITELKFDGNEHFHTLHIREAHGMGNEYIVLTPGSTTNLLTVCPQAFSDGGMVYKITEKGGMSFSYLAIHVDALVFNQAFRDDPDVQAAVLENFKAELGNSCIVPLSHCCARGNMDFISKFISNSGHLIYKDTCQYRAINRFMKQCDNYGICLGEGRKGVEDHLGNGLPFIEALETSGFQIAA